MYILLNIDKFKTHQILNSQKTPHIKALRESNARLLANASAFWAGQDEN